MACGTAVQKSLGRELWSACVTKDLRALRNLRSTTARDGLACWRGCRGSLRRVRLRTVADRAAVGSLTMATLLSAGSVSAFCQRGLYLQYVCRVSLARPFTSRHLAAR